MTLRHTFKSTIATFFLSLVILPAFFLAPLSVNTAHAQGSTPGGPLPTSRYSQVTAKTMGCSWTRPSGCFAALAKTIFVDGGYLLFIVAGNVFDVLMALSLSSTMANNEALVNIGWEISRDIANTFFIFVLLYIAIMLILQLGGGQTKRMLATLIVVGLLINFSMYITKFVIDVGNVFALEFYNAIDGDPITWFTLNGGQDITPKSVTQGFADRLGNGTLTSQDFYDSLIKAKLGNGTMAFIFIMIGIMFYITTFIFFAAGFLFLSRLITFWICMIFSPLAIFSLTLPRLKSLIWDKWFHMLVEASALAPIFLFFVYLVMQLVNNMGNGFVQGNQSGAAITIGNIIITLIAIALNFGTVIGLLMYALKLTQSMAGQIGASVSQIGSKVVTGATFGAAGWAGRKFIGGGAQYLSNKWGDKMETSDNPYFRKMGQYANAGLKGVAGSSFDARNVKAVKDASGATGIALAAGGGLGGYQKKAQEKSAAIQKRAEELLKAHPNNPEMAAKYLASQRKSIADNSRYERGLASGKGMSANTPLAGMRMNPDEFAMGAWKNFSVKDRQRMIESMKEGPEKEYLKALNKGMATAGNEEKEQFELKIQNAKASGAEKYQSFVALNPKLQGEAYKTMTAAQRTELREAEKSYLEANKGSVSTLDAAHKALSREDQERVIEADQKSAKIISERKAKDNIDARKNALATADAVQAKLILHGSDTEKGMSAKDIAKLPAETLVRAEVAQNLGASALMQAVQSGELTDQHVTTIVNAIMENRETADRKTLETISKGIGNQVLSDEAQRKLIQTELSRRDGEEPPKEPSKIIIPPDSRTA